MRTALRWIVRVVAGVGVAVVAVAFAACFTDGPIAIFPGGPLRGGELVETGEIDWDALAEVREVELESGGRSRTTWFVVHEGQAYVPCSLNFPPFKRWHEEALADPRAVLRVEGKRYRRTLRRVDDPALHRVLFDKGGAKYGGGPSSSPEEQWFFHLAPPDA